MAALFWVLRTGGPWSALQETGLGSSRAAPRRGHDWAAAGVWRTWWPRGLADFDAVHGSDGEWLALDGALTQAPLGGETGGQAPPTVAKPAPSAVDSPTDLPPTSCADPSEKLRDSSLFRTMM
jgi:hypothetical protein